jgi:hypothetical protein
MEKICEKMFKRISSKELFYTVANLSVRPLWRPENYNDNIKNESYTCGYETKLLTNNQFDFIANVHADPEIGVWIICYLSGIFEETQTKPDNLQIAVIKEKYSRENFDTMVDLAADLMHRAQQYRSEKAWNFAPMSKWLEYYEKDIELQKKRIYEYNEVLKSKRDTIFDLFNHTLRLVKENGKYADFEKIIEYVLPNENEPFIIENVEITNYEFDIRCVPHFGGSEGIYLDCYLDGGFDEDTREYTKRDFATFKTLNTDIDAMIIMGALGGAVTYYATEYVNRNKHKYTPKAELLKDIEQAKEKLAKDELCLEYLKAHQ